MIIIEGVGGFEFGVEVLGGLLGEVGVRVARVHHVILGGHGLLFGGDGFVVEAFVHSTITAHDLVNPIPSFTARQTIIGPLP